MKTGAYWFKFLTDKEQEEFKVNSKKEKCLIKNMNDKFESFDKFIYGSFIHANTPQDYNYWHEISQRKVE